MECLKPPLLQRLKERAIRHDILDAHTVVLSDVPTATSWFSQPTTSLMVKRPAVGQPFVVCVDPELNYLGADPAVSQAFHGGIRRQGWRTLILTLPSHLDLDAVVQEALKIVGFDREAPCVSPRAIVPRTPRTILERFQRGLTASSDAPAPVFGRDDEILDAATALLSNARRHIPLITGPSGSGKSTVLRGVAEFVERTRPDRRVVGLHLNELVVGVTHEGEFENIFAQLVREAEADPGMILAVEHFELLAMGRTAKLLCQALDRGSLPLVGVISGELVERIRPPLRRRVLPIRLCPMTQDALRELLRYEAKRISGLYELDVTPRMADVCWRAAEKLPGGSPHRELTLLDLAASRSRLTGASELSADDIHRTAHQILTHANNDAEDEP